MEGNDLIDKYTAQASTTEEATEKGLKALGLSRDEAVIEVVEEGKKGFLGFGQKDAVVTVRRKEGKSLLDDVLPQSSLRTRSETETEKQPSETAAELAETDPEEPDTVEESEAVEEIEESKEVVPSSNEDEESLSDEWDDDEDDFEEDDTEDVAESDDDEVAIQEVTDYLQSIGEAMGAGPIDVEVEYESSRIYFNLITKKVGIVIGHHGKVLNALQSLAQVQLHKQADRKLTAVVDAEGYRKRREDTLRNLANRTAKKVNRTKQPVVLEPMPAFERKLIHRFLGDNSGVTTHSEGKEPHRYLVIEPSLEKKSVLDK